MNDTLVQMLAEGSIRPRIDQRPALEQVGEAMRAVVNRIGSGKNCPQDKVKSSGDGK